MKTLFISVLLATGLGMGLVHAGIIPVYSADDDGPGTLRQAIVDANNASEPSTIKFSIGEGVQVIHVGENTGDSLPPITQRVVINGMTQPGYAGTPLIEIDGNEAPAADGLVIAAGGCAIYGLAIHSFNSSPGHPAYQVNVASTGAIIRSNYLGLTATGECGPGPFQWFGLHLNNSSGCEIGGPGCGRNVISGNQWYGVYIDGPSATNNVVEGNYIGTDINGTGAHANGSGVYVSLGGENRIGGSAAGSRNIISGNPSNGVEIVSSSWNLVQNNYIGTDQSGTVAVPNGESGVRLGSLNDGLCSSNQIIGNVISGNFGDGVCLGPTPVLLACDPINFNLISGNSIGVDKNGAALANGVNGINMFASCARQNVAASNIIAHNSHDGVYLSGSNNIIGAANSIHDNGHNGVTVATNDGPGLFNSIRSNSIYANAAIGIDLGNDGRTFNDLGDGDTGANDLQNYPMLTDAHHCSSCVSVRGTLNSEANKIYVLDFFLNRQCGCTCDCTGQQYFIGSLSLTTDGDGNASFDTVFSFQSPVGPDISAITATATSPEGNTSEYTCAFVPAEPITTCLSVRQAPAGHVVISWTDDGHGWGLESSTDLSSTVWNEVTPQPTCAAGTCSVTVLASEHAMFFRLSCP